MSGPSKVIVLDPDPRAGRLVQLGFEREGIGCTLADLADQARPSLELPPETGAILVGGAGAAAIDGVRRAREVLQAANLDIPIISAGRDAAATDLRAAGADEVLARPTYLRDVVTVCRILHGVPAQKRDHLVGNLAETTGVYTLVRALGSLGRSGVLTLIRGLRRGEVRFYQGEVTSAEVGLIHGQAALHQLLLWTDARFDFAHQDIVRRAQIPLSPEELFADAERFLEGVRDAAGGLSPSTVLEQNVQRIHDHGKQIPTEVYGVLRMFDGHRVLADILEDSPYRVFETLRVAEKAVEAGLLRRVESQRPKATWRAVLAIDEWLVGNETRDAVVERTADLDSGPTTQRRNKSRGKKSRGKRVQTPVAGSKAEIDWGALVPRVIGAEVGPLSTVVPALAAHGELDLPTRDRAREKLEALMDTGKRDRIFPTEVGMEPKVVVAGLEVEPKRPDPAEAETVGAGKKAKKKREAVRAAERAFAEKARAEAERAEAERAAKAKIAAEMAKIEAERVATEKARADEQARIDALRVTPLAIPAQPAHAEEPARADEQARIDARRADEQARIDALRVTPMKVEAQRDGLAGETLRGVPTPREPASGPGARSETDAPGTMTGETLRGVAAPVEAVRAAEAERAREALAGETLRTAPTTHAAPGPETTQTEADRARLEAARAAERIAEADRSRIDALAGDTVRTAAPGGDAVDLEARARLERAARVDTDRIAAARAEAERIAAEKLRFEDERAPAAAPTDEERIRLERAAKIDTDRIAAARAEAERIAAEKLRFEAERGRVVAPTDEEERIRLERAAKIDTDRIAAARAEAERIAAEKLRFEAERAARTKPTDEEERIRLERAAKIDTDRIAIARAEAERIAAEKLRFEAERAARTDAAEAERIAKDKIAAEMARLEAERVAIEQARVAEDQRAAAAPPSEEVAAATGKVVEDAKAYAARVKAAAEARKAEQRVIDAAHATSGGDARDLVRQLVVDAGVEPVSGATTLPVRADADADTQTRPFVRTEITPPITVSETSGTSVAVADVVTVSRSADASVVTASPRVLITETPRAVDDATPHETDDEPSDGVIRSMIATADTARAAALARAAMTPPPAHDGPPVKETTGEIGDVRVRTGVQEKVVLEESITVEPSILVADLASAHAASAAAYEKAEPPPGDAASASQEREVAQVRRDAVAFSEAEEAFFNRAESGTAQVPKFESFDDLDDGYQPPTFWDRVFGRDKKK